MTLTVLNVIYVIVAIAMLGFILVQRGAGAQAGSGFGAGASATVFGARGAGNFLTRSTAVLAGIFFLLSLGMGMYVSRASRSQSPETVGVMADQPAAVEIPVEVPAPASDVPTPEAAPSAAPTASEVPAAPSATPSATPTAPAPGDGAETPPTR